MEALEAQRRHWAEEHRVFEATFERERGWLEEEGARLQEEIEAERHEKAKEQQRVEEELRLAQEKHSQTLHIQGHMHAQERRSLEEGQAKERRSWEEERDADVRRWEDQLVLHRRRIAEERSVALRLMEEHYQRALQGQSSEYEHRRRQLGSEQVRRAASVLFVAGGRLLGSRALFGWRRLTESRARDRLKAAAERMRAHLCSSRLYWRRLEVALLANMLSLWKCSGLVFFHRRGLKGPRVRGLGVDLGAPMRKQLLRGVILSWRARCEVMFEITHVVGEQEALWGHEGGQRCFVAWRVWFRQERAARRRALRKERLADFAISVGSPRSRGSVVSAFSNATFVTGSSAERSPQGRRDGGGFGLPMDALRDVPFSPEQPRVNGMLTPSQLLPAAPASPNSGRSFLGFGPMPELPGMPRSPASLASRSPRLGASWVASRPAGS